MLAAHMELDDRRPSTCRAGVLEQPAHRQHAWPESGRPVRCHPRPPRQSRVDHGDQSDSQPAGRRPRARSACDAASWWSCPTACSTRTRPRSRTCCCPPPDGARRTARSPTPSDASRDSAPSCRRPAKRKPDWWIISQVARASVTRRPSRSKRRTRFSRSTLPLSGVAERRHARVRHQRPGCTEQPTTTIALEPIQWPVPVANHPGTARLLSDGRFFHADGKARFVATPPRAPGNAPERGVSAGAQHRSHPRPVAHDDPHGLCTAPDRSHARALRRHARAGRAARRHARRRAGARRHAAGARSSCACASAARCRAA